MNCLFIKQKSHVIWVLSVLLLFMGCWEFLSIEQPDLADPNSIFDVPITVSLTPEEEGGRGYFGIRLPIGWTVEDSISYTGILSGTFIYSSEQSDSMEVYESSPNGYHWWVSVCDSVDSLSEGNISFTPRITTDEQTGTFLIDYIISDRIANFSGYVVHSGPYPISVDAPMTATVTNTNDSGEGSLRQAISDVSSRGEILFDLSYPATITLDSQLVIDRSVTITGPESGELTISGNNKCLVLYINERLKVNISNLTISNSYNSGGIYCNSSNLSLQNVSITGNNANDGYGGGISCYKSDLNLENVSVTNNIANNGGGIFCSASNLNFKNVSIIGNFAKGWLINDEIPRDGDGGGIFCRNSDLNFSNVTITSNSARNVGGGITFADSSNIVFDSETRSNIYFNHAFLGNDLYNDNYSIVNVVLDTFTVLYPNSYHAYLPRNFNFDILNAKIIQSDADLYVKSDGDNSNSGTSSPEALKTISFAFMKIMADSLNPRVIYIDDGIYSPSTNGEDFPLRIPNYVSLSGTTRDGVILDAEQQSAVIQIFLDDHTSGTPPPRYKQINSIENMSITGGNASGIQCWESILNLNNILITDNSSINGEGHNYGGGITCENSILNLTNGIISNNIAEGGGGGIKSPASIVNLSNVTISSNSTGAGWHGGGIKGGDLSLTNVRIIGNSGGYYGGGIAFFDKINLAGVTIANNHALYGGGIRLGLSDPDDIFFDTENRCNIYSNQAARSGDDLYYKYDDTTRIAIVVDTFTVLNPTEEHAYPIDKYTFDILHDASGLTDINEKTNNLPVKFALKQNYPNPFNPITMINYQLPMSNEVELSVYNLLGQKVVTLVYERKEAGYHQVEWDASGFASGVYLYRIEAGEFQDVKKMILIR